MNTENFSAENEPEAALRAGRGGDATDRDGLGPDMGARRAAADAGRVVDEPRRRRAVEAVNGPWRRREVIGDATLYLGDARDILPTPRLGMIGVIVTDPPYGCSAVLGMGGGSKGDGGQWKGRRIDGDEDCSVRDAVLSVSKEPFAVLGKPLLPSPPRTEHVLVWDKGEHTGAGDLLFPWKPNIELIFLAGCGWLSDHRDSSVIRVNAIAGCVGTRNDGARWHPFEKPVALMRYLIERSNTLGAVCDPFMGSATTALAAISVGRRFIGIESDREFFDIALRRISDAYRQGDLIRDRMPHAAAVVQEAML